MEKARPWLGDPKRTVEILQKYGFRFRKKFGQNFLIDPRVLEKITAAADITEEDVVLEIGPGIGTLTQYLAEKAKEVICIEIDNSLMEIHEETLADWDNITVLFDDVMKVDLAALLAEKSPGRRVKVAANLPYYITTPVIMALLEQELPLESVTVMIQKEVAERIAAQPGNKNYGALTLAVQYYADVYLAANVPPNCFIPRPDVSSAVIRMDLKKDKIPVKDPGRMKQIIRAAFSKRRKTLVNCLRSDEGAGFSREQVEAALAALGLPADVRGETLSLEQFAALSDLLDGQA